ncbi:unnamed protein product [Arabidopsis lyrata]|nr:unnamed protein product [Arabidopsis lyrata]
MRYTGRAGVCRASGVHVSSRAHVSRRAAPDKLVAPNKHVAPWDAPELSCRIVRALPIRELPSRTACYRARPRVAMPDLLWTCLTVSCRAVLELLSPCILPSHVGVVEPTYRTGGLLRDCRALPGDMLPHQGFHSMSLFPEDYVREELEVDEYRRLEQTLDGFGADQGVWLGQSEAGDPLGDLDEKDSQYLDSLLVPENVEADQVPVDIAESKKAEEVVEESSAETYFSHGHVKSLSTLESLTKMFAQCQLSSNVEFLVPKTHERPSDCPDGYIYVYEPYFTECRLWFPLPEFLTSYCSRRNIAFSQLSVASIRNAAGLVILASEENIDVNIQLFKEVTTFSIGRQNPGIVCASSRRNFKIVYDARSMTTDWRKRFFFVKLNEASVEDIHLSCDNVWKMDPGFTDRPDGLTKSIRSSLSILRAKRALSWPRVLDHFRTSNSGRSACFGRAADSGRSACFGRAADSGRSACFGRAADSGRSTCFGRAADSGRSACFGRAADSGRSACCGRAADSGRSACFGRAANSGRSACFGRAADSGRSACFGRAADSGRSACFGRAANSGRSACFGRAADSGRSPCFGRAANSGRSAFSGRAANYGGDLFLVVVGLGSTSSASEMFYLTLGSDLCGYKGVDPLCGPCILAVEPIQDGLNEIVHVGAVPPIAPTMEAAPAAAATASAVGAPGAGTA